MFVRTSVDSQRKTTGVADGQIYKSCMAVINAGLKCAVTPLSTFLRVGVTQRSLGWHLFPVKILVRHCL